MKILQYKAILSRLHNPTPFTREQAKQIAKAMQGDDHNDFIFTAIPAPVDDKYFVGVRRVESMVYFSFVCIPTQFLPLLEEACATN